MAFKYQKRDATTVDKRASQQGDSFKGFIKDEYKVWSPKKGDNWVRILPPTWDKADHYGLDVHVHFFIGPEKASIICNLKQHGSRCAICEAKVKLEGSKSATDEEIGQLRASKRVVAYILDMKDESKGVQIWAMPWTVDRDISKISKDKRDGTTYFIDDPEEGYDVFFDREGENINTKYTGFQLSRRPSSVDERHLDFIADNPLPEVFVERTYAEAQSLYTGGMSDEETPRGGREDDRRPARRDAVEDRRPARRDEDEDRRPARRDEDERPAARSRSRDDGDPRTGPARPDTLGEQRRRREEEEEPRPNKRDRAEREEEVAERPKSRARDEVDDDEIPALRDKSSRQKDLPEEEEERPASRRRASLPDDEEPPFKRDHAAESNSGKSRADALRERLASAKGGR